VFIGILLGRGDEYYIYNLLLSLLAWRWVSSSITTSTNSIIARSSLINQVYIPKYIFPLTQVFYSTWKFLIIFSFLLLGYSLLGIYSANLLFVPLVLVIFFLFAVGGSLLVAAVTPFAQDFKYLVPQVMQVIFYGSGVVFDKSFVPEKFHSYLELNPLFNCFEQLKNVVVRGVSPDFASLGASFCIAVSIIGLGAAILFRFDKVYPKII
jgi:ABC-type polysaccharide/polyol phosphate export permease